MLALVVVVLVVDVLDEEVVSDDFVSSSESVVVVVSFDESSEGFVVFTSAYDVLFSPEELDVVVSGASVTGSPHTERTTAVPLG